MCSLLFKTGLYSWKHTLIECETFQELYLFYFVWLSLYVRKLFSEINILNEARVKQKLEINMLDKLFQKIASLKTSWSEKSVKYRSSRSQMCFKIAILKNAATVTAKRLCSSLFFIKLQPRGPATLLKRDSNISVFLWILRNF